MKDFGTSESPKSTRSSTTHWCPGRPGHPAFRHNIASSLRLHTGLPYDWTPRSDDAPLGSPLAPSARRVSRVASRLPGTTRLRFALHGGQRLNPRTRSSTTHWCPGRPGHPAFRHNIASSLRLHTGLPYDWTPRSDAPLGSPLAPSARRVSRVASRLPGTTRLRFALHGGQQMSMAAFSCGLTEAHEGSRARVRIESTQISAFFSVGYHAQQGIFILLGSKRLSRETHPPPIPQGQPPRVGLFRCRRLCFSMGSCGKLRTSRVSQPPSPALDSSLIAPFLSVFERVNMRRSPEVRDIPCPGTPAPGPAHL